MNKKIRIVQDGYVISGVINKAKRSGFDKRLYLLLVLTSETGIKPSDLINKKKQELFGWKVGQILYDGERAFKVTQKCIDAINLYKKQGKPFKRMVSSDKVFTGKKLSVQKPAHHVNTFMPQFKQILGAVLNDFGRESEYNLDELSMTSFRYHYFYKLHKKGVSVSTIAGILKKRKPEMLRILEVVEPTYIDYL